MADGTTVTVLGCNEYMVDTVTDDKLTASSIYDDDYLPAKARLSSTGWSPDAQEDDPWIQVDFGRPLTIVAVVTKGLDFRNLDEYVKKYKVRYSNTSVNWMLVYNGTNDEFEANSDRTTPVTNTLPSPIVARYLRLYPTEHHRYRSLRFDVIGFAATTTLTVPTSTISSPTTSITVKTETTTSSLSSSTTPTTPSTATTTDTLSSQVTSTNTNTPTIIMILSSQTTTHTLFSPTTFTTTRTSTSTNTLPLQDTPTTSSKPATTTTSSHSTVSTSFTTLSESTITTIMSSPTTTTTSRIPTTTNALSKTTTTSVLSSHTLSTTFTFLSTRTISTTTLKSTLFNSTRAGPCTCTCIETNATMTPQAVQERIDNIVKNLTISKKKTSKYIRSKTSAQDARPEVVYVGSVAVAIICVFASLVVLPDLCTMIRFLFSVMKRKQRKKRKTLKKLGQMEQKMFVN
ncbi:uncharacterized protein [Magallana gigas]|uniref:uncharacterized protein n=1 Tax=Magallana gigas TaxID=29159 RepID=UPI003340E6AA